MHNISIHVHELDGDVDGVMRVCVPILVKLRTFMYSHGNPVTDVILAMDYDSLAPPGDPLPVRGGSVATPD